MGTITTITVRCIAVLLVCSSCLAQSPAVESVYDHRPRLECEPRLNLNGGGFNLVSASMTCGTGMENEHTVWHVYGTYNAVTKADFYDGNTGMIVHNPHGNVRSVGASAFFRTTGGWLFGAQGSYASLRTTLFSKVSWGLGLGAGKDFGPKTCPNCVGAPVTMRLLILYSLPVSCYSQANLHCLITEVDKEQGITAQYTVPSPSETQRHFFFRVTAFAGIIKTTEHGSYTHDGGAMMGPLFRF